MPDITISRAVARKLVDLMPDLPEDAHPLVVEAMAKLIEAIDVAQGGATDAEPEGFEITVTGTEMELPEDADQA